MKGRIFEILYSENPEIQTPEAKLDAIEEVLMDYNQLSEGDVVSVFRATDNTMNMDYIGKVGTVDSINSNRATGNTKDDPLYIVEFPDGTKESFWKEELLKLNK